MKRKPKANIEVIPSRIPAKDAWKLLRRPGRIKNARKIKTAEGTFDSEAELRRWNELKLLRDAGAIQNLRNHVPFAIVVNGVKICDYEADFVYTENGQQVVEDVKGHVTDVYKLKRKMMRAVFGVAVREIKLAELGVNVARVR